MLLALQGTGTPGAPAAPTDVGREYSLLVVKSLEYRIAADEPHFRLGRTPATNFRIEADEPHYRIATQEPHYRVPKTTD